MSRTTTPKPLPARPGAATPAGVAPLWTMADVAEYLGIHVESVRRLIARGELRAYRYGKRMVRIDPADVERMRRPIGGRR